jgi:hypothetical protein
VNIFYNMEGKPISIEEWMISFDTPEARRVASTTLPNGKWVSTVLLGIDHSFSMKGPPLIFETMVFESKNHLKEVDMERYSTKEEALVGHVRLVENWSTP